MRPPEATNAKLTGFNPSNEMTMPPTPSEQRYRKEEDALFLKCHFDFPTYAKTNLKIQNIKTELVPLDLNNIQMLLEDIWLDIERNMPFVRLYILKARRFGVSTWVTGRFFWRTSLHENRYSVVVTHEPQATDYLFKMQKRYYDNSHPEFKPETKYNNTSKLEFNTSDGQGLDSAIRVGTANVGDFGSAMMIHDLLMSESAKYPQTSQKELEASILQCVPKVSDTAVVFESTAKGLGGEFYKGFWACRIRYEIYLNAEGKPAWRKVINPDADPSNQYCAVFIPAFAFLEYRMPVPEEFVRTAEEEKLVRTFNVPDEYLQWRRLTLANECKGDINVFHQEYPHTAREAFISSGTPSFDVEKVMQAREIALKFPPIARYECLKATGQWIARPDGELLVWEEPRPGTPYLVSADVAEGLEHGDFDSASVWNHHTGVQVAHYHGHMDPYDFATYLNHLGRRYNNAWMVVERNNHGRGVVDRLLKDFMYPYIYVEKIVEPPNKPRKRFGWETNVKTRPLVIDNLKYQVHSDAHGIRCVECFDEMLNFKRQADGKEEADPGTFDDRVMECAIGKYALRRLLPVPVQQTTQQGAVNTVMRRPQPITARLSSKKPDGKAFT